MAQDLGTGVVEGAAALNVRQGPGASNPSIGMLRRGDRVRVQEIVGKWARVSSGELNGYVHSAFIRMDIETEPAPVPPDAAPTPTAMPASESDHTGEATEAAAAPEPAGFPIEVREDIRRILALSEELQKDLETMRSRPTPAAPKQEEGISVQSGIGLLGLGAVIGFFVGMILGRQQERGSRSRVRI